jgi:hypothetical protein
LNQAPVKYCTYVADAQGNVTGCKLADTASNAVCGAPNDDGGCAGVKRTEKTATGCTLCRRWYVDEMGNKVYPGANGCSATEADATFDCEPFTLPGQDGYDVQGSCSEEPDANNQCSGSCGARPVLRKDGCLPKGDFAPGNCKSDAPGGNGGGGTGGSGGVAGTGGNGGTGGVGGDPVGET